MRTCWFWIGDINWHISKVIQRILQDIFEQQHYNRQNNLTSLKQQQQRSAFYKRESQVWLGLGRDSSRRSSYPETHRAAEAEIRANSPSCPDCSRIKLPQFLTQCLRNMSKTVRIGADSRWVGGWVLRTGTARPAEFLSWGSSQWVCKWRRRLVMWIRVVF